MKVKVAFTASIIFLFVLSLGIDSGQSPAQAQTASADSLTTEAARMDRMGGTLGDGKVIDKLSAEFGSFLGADAKAVVTGLRNGTPITLTASTAGTTPGSTPTTTITPPTGKMGFGNVFISLALAKQQLSQLGITQPTPAQLQAGLLGGTITSGTGTSATSTNLAGILTLKSQNMGWGQIAQKLGFKLGSVVSGLKAANHGLAVGAASTSGAGIVNAGGQPVGSSESGVVTGSGKSVGRSGKGASAREEIGAGIVTGSGRSLGASSGITTGRGHANGVSGSASTGAARGKGHDK